MDDPQQMSNLTCDQARRWLFDRIDYERVRPDVGVSNPFRLERTERLLKLIDSPQHRIPCVHIAGTKGKGSTAAMLESILRCSGLCTGLFTSPHIHNVEERMKVDGRPPPAEEFAALVNSLNTILTPRKSTSSDHIPTFFETTTLLAWMMFDRGNVDIAVLETGLGGRLDCTNVCRPLVTVITSIGLDHMHILGDTLQQIAAEKAGILKPEIPVVIGKLPPAAETVVRQRADELNCPLFASGHEFSVEQRLTPDRDSSDSRGHEVFSVRTPTETFTNIRLPLRGKHQVENAAVAVMTSQLLSNSEQPVTETHVNQGLLGVECPVRFEVVMNRPTVILDAAHNPDSSQALIETLNEYSVVRTRRILVFGVSADKDVGAMLSILLPQFDSVVLTRFVGNPRGLAIQTLQEMVLATGYAPGRVSIAETPESAVESALNLADQTGLICVTGSLFLAAEVRGILESRQRAMRLTSRV
jgi:dihydrofolate synthase / folylpolyglutamate synthase